MVAWMLQVLNGTIHANKESLFLKVWVICYTESLVITADVWKIVQGRHWNGSIKKKHPATFNFFYFRLINITSCSECGLHQICQFLLWDVTPLLHQGTCKFFNMSDIFWTLPHICGRVQKQILLRWRFTETCSLRYLELTFMAKLNTCRRALVRVMTKNLMVTSWDPWSYVEIGVIYWRTNKPLLLYGHCSLLLWPHLLSSCLPAAALWHVQASEKKRRASFFMVFFRVTRKVSLMS